MQHATSSSNIRPPGRCGPGEVRLIEVGSQAAQWRVDLGRHQATNLGHLQRCQRQRHRDRNRDRATKWAPPHARHVAVHRRCRCRCVSTAAHLGTLDGNGARCDMPDHWLAKANAIVIAASAGVDVDGAGDYSTPVATLETTQKCMRSRTLRQFVGN